MGTVTEVALELMAVSGVQGLAAVVASWVSRSLTPRIALFSVSQGRKRRLCAVGLPARWHLSSPPDAPWSPTPDPAGRVVPGEHADRLHSLFDARGELIGGLLLPDGSPLASWVGPIGQVLERVVAADQALLRSRLLDEVLLLVRDGVIAVNADGDLLAYGAGLRSLTGWTADEVRRHGWTSLVYPDPANRTDAQRSIAALLRGWPSEGVVRTLSRKDGSEVRVAIWNRVVPDPAEGSAALLGVFHDDTSSEETRRRSAREEGLFQLGRIAGGIAHEYNNLLCAVMGHAELIESTVGVPPAVVRRAETIGRAARRGAHLSSQLLAFTGTSKGRSEGLDVAEVVGQVRDLYGPRLPHGVSLALSTTSGDCFAEVDATQLQQAVMNLVVNGAESMRFGGELRVEVRLAPLPTDVRYLAPHAPAPGTEMVEIRVVDQGPGFSAAALQHLFEPFFTEKPEGHGMGLPAVRGMLAMHDGAAHAHNGVPPTGGVMTLWLPRSTRPERQLVASAHPHRNLPPRVWILDDQTPVLEFSRVSLEAAGVEVEVFSGVVDLLAHDAPVERRPHLLVLDVQLPDGDGPSALAVLRQRGHGGPVLWSTGYTPDTFVMPPGPVIRKPYTGADLVEAVVRAWSSSEPPRGAA